MEIDRTLLAADSRSAAPDSTSKAGSAAAPSSAAKPGAPAGPSTGASTSPAASTRFAATVRAADGPFVASMKARFERREREAGGNGAVWLAPLRREAFDRFCREGLPTTHDEAWRCTSVAALDKTAFGDGATGAAPATEAKSLLDLASFGADAAIRLVFVSGRFAPEWSSTGTLPGGVKVASLREAIASDRALVEPHLGRLAVNGTPFAALNTAFLEDGAFVSIPAGAEAVPPIFLLFLTCGSHAADVVHPRTLIVAGERSRATIIESYAGGGNGSAYFTNAVTEIVAGDGAAIDHYKLQRESERAFHIASLQATMGRGASFVSHSISLGGALVRNDIGAVLDGEGAECTLNGLFLGSNRQHVDNHTVIDHAKPHGTSRETYKGILDGQSRGVFDGSIIVRQDAQKTDSRQANRNLLLSDGALIDTKPQLEIRADDVKCAHAATIGRLDETSLFYLRSRGLGMHEARALLIHAFAGEVLAHIQPLGLRAGVDAAVSRMLLGAAFEGEPA